MEGVLGFFAMVALGSVAAIGLGVIEFLAGNPRAERKYHKQVTVGAFALFVLSGMFATAQVLSGALVVGWKSFAPLLPILVVGYLSHDFFPDSFEKGHRNWAMTWFVMALTALGVFVWEAREPTIAFLSARGIGLRQLVLAVLSDGVLAYTVTFAGISLVFYGVVNLFTHTRLYRHVVAVNLLLCLWILSEA